MLAAIPLLLAACTAFTKVSIVLAALRHGLGAERLLPAASMLALALVVTALAMAPVLELSAMELERVGEGGQLDWAALLEPLWVFLREHVDARELERFVALTGRAAEDPAALVPAFLVGELAEGLRLAVMVLLPFVVVDLLAAQVISLLGLQTTPASVLALPAKLLLFLAADGWQLVIVGLIEGYQ
nr:flagellar type III secretion system pore protein FliP [Pseudenhygromyxa sp. WMMC2535]